jgi:hypothetical protein
LPFSKLSPHSVLQSTPCYAPNFKSARRIAHYARAAVNNTGPSIQFTNGRLNFTERFWATGANDTAMALFGAVSSLNNDGFHACDVTAGVNTSPDITAHNVWISCGDKSVLINRDTIGQHTYTMVHEELGREREITK